jgi:hypothetical protein
MLSAIVQKVTGQTVMDYLMPRLFEPLGITDITFDTCPMGINTGGWGLSIRTEDIAKFGLLYAQKGLWHGQQILPAAWIEEATAAVVRNDGEGRDNDPTDWRQGYGYQFWRCRHNAYRGDGAFGQYCLVMPDQDAVLVITSDTSDMQGILDLVWEHLLPAMQADVLPMNEDQKVLQERLTSLSLPVPSKSNVPADVLKLNGKTFIFAKNKTGLKSTSFTFADDGCRMKLEDKFGRHTIQIGSGEWKENCDRMAFMKPTMINLWIGAAPQEAFQFVAAGTWNEDEDFSITMHYLETPHREYLTAQFAGDTVVLKIHSSMVDPDDPQYAMMETVFTGKVE